MDFQESVLVLQSKKGKHVAQCVSEYILYCVWTLGAVFERALQNGLNWLGLRSRECKHVGKICLFSSQHTLFLAFYFLDC